VPIRPLVHVVAYLLLAAAPFAFGQLSNYYAEVLTTVAVFVILAASVDLVVGVAGQITLGHAAFFAIGAYSSAILTARYAVAPVVAIAAGMFLSALAAYLIGLAVLRLKGYYLAMATLGLTAVTFTLLVGVREWTGGAAGFGGIPRFRLAGFEFSDGRHYYLLVLAAAFLVVVAARTLLESAYGRALIAVHADEATATALGVDASRYKVSVFVFACALAALAGSLFAHHLRFIAPDDFTIAQSIHILVMAYLGGIGTIYGAALGAFTLQVLPEFVHHFKDYERLGTGVVLILVLAFFPGGLYGLVRGVGERMRLRRARLGEAAIGR